MDIINLNVLFMKTTSVYKVFASAILITLTSGQLMAQAKKGNILTESSVGNIYIGNSNSSYETVGTYPNKSTSKSQSFSLDLYPSVGIFLSDKLVVGGKLDLYFYSSKYKSYDDKSRLTNDSKSSNISLGLLPFVRYYFWKNADEKSLLYAQASGGGYFYLTDKYESKNYDVATGLLTYNMEYEYPEKYKRYAVEVMVGWNRFLSENVALNIGLGYNYSKSSQSNRYIYNYSSGLTTTSDLNKSEYKYSQVRWDIGLSIFIPRNK